MSTSAEGTLAFLFLHDLGNAGPRQGVAVTGLMDLFHAVTFPLLGQLSVVSPAVFPLMWSIQTLLHVQKSGSWAATSLGFKTQLTVAATMET